jgi:hypothetical protein
MMEKTFYQAMTGLPRHIEERLLEFNILQLCALVSEKSGPRWTGASDRYGPIKEIERRWDLKDLTLRIENMKVEEPLKTYARVVTSLGGDPGKEVKVIDPKMGVHGYDKIKEKIASKTRPLEQDAVRTGLEKCLCLDDLKRVAKEQRLDHLDWDKIDGLANFGLKRMYVGNQWRTRIRREAKNT